MSSRPSTRPPIRFLQQGELAEEFDVTRQAITYRSKRRRESGLVDRKRTGASAVAWRGEVAPRLSPEARRRANAANRETAVSLDDLEAEFADDA